MEYYTKLLCTRFTFTVYTIAYNMIIVLLYHATDYVQRACAHIKDKNNIIQNTLEYNYCE